MFYSNSKWIFRLGLENQDSDEEDQSDASEGESQSEPEQSGSGSDGDDDADSEGEGANGNVGWADSIAKILKTNKPKGKKTLILSKAKKHKITKTESEPKVGFEVIDENGEEKEVIVKKEENVDEEEPVVKKVMYLPKFLCAYFCFVNFNFFFRNVNCIRISESNRIFWKRKRKRF